MTLNLSLPFEAAYIIWKLSQAGQESFLVGGAVRDLLLAALYQLSGEQQGQPAPVVDYDFTTSATPEEIQQIFPDSYYTNDFGQVGVSYDHLVELMTQDGLSLPEKKLATSQLPAVSEPKLIDLAQATKIHSSLAKAADSAHDQEANSTSINQPPPFEITTYRSDGFSADHRHPDSVTWGKSIDDDLQRRDFTINALAIKIEPNALKKFFTDGPITSQLQLDSTNFTLIDQHGGFQDLTQKIIRTVGVAADRINEDALRSLRAIRLAVQLGMKIDDQTWTAIKENHQLLANISGERIRDELFKMLASPQPAQAIEWLATTGLLAHFMPELLAGQGVAQGGHHTTDVWTHSLAALAACPSPDPIVRLATLLHDIGKPVTYQVKNGQITFYNHEVIGARIASKIGARLKLTKALQQRLFTLVRQHMFYYQPTQTDGAIRRMMKRMGLANIDDLIDLREADRLGSGAKQTSWRLEELKQRMINQLHQPFDLTDLAIDGHDLMTEFKLGPGPKIGLILTQLLTMVLDQPELNDRQQLLAIAQKIISGQLLVEK